MDEPDQHPSRDQRRLRVDDPLIERGVGAIDVSEVGVVTGDRMIGQSAQQLGIKLWVNDVIKQDSNTSDMIFNLAEQLSHLSSRITLYPGDIILTGTPAGVGAARREFLKPGDVTKVWVENVGTLTNKMA